MPRNIQKYRNKKPLLNNWVINKSLVVAAGAFFDSRPLTPLTQIWSHHWPLWQRWKLRWWKNSLCEFTGKFTETEDWNTILLMIAHWLWSLIYFLIFLIIGGFFPLVSKRTLTVTTEQIDILIPNHVLMRR